MANGMLKHINILSLMGPWELAVSQTQNELDLVVKYWL